MNTYEAALRVVWKHRIYVLIYLVGLSVMMMALLINSFSSGMIPSGKDADYSPERASVAVIDRDANAGNIAHDLREYLSATCELVVVQDTPQALQDAVATNYTDLMVIVPEGYAQGFAQAALAGDQPTGIETVTSFTSGVGSMASMRVDGYLSLLRTAYLAKVVTANDAEQGTSGGAASQPSRETQTARGTQPSRGTQPASGTLTASQMSTALEESSKQVLATAKDSRATATTSIVQTTENTEHVASSIFGYAMKFGGYPILASLIVTIALISNVFSEAQIRRRIAVAPQHSTSISAGVLAACVMVGLLSVVYYVAVSVVLLMIIGGNIGQIDVGGLLMSITSMLCYAVVAVAIGFAVAQCSASEQAANGFANVFSLVVAFTSGVWFDPSIMPDIMISLGKWLPGWWYSDAVDRALGTGAYLGEPANSTAWLSSTLLVLLFAGASVCFGLAVGAMRRRYPGQLVSIRSK